MQKQVERLRGTKPNVANSRLSIGGFLAEIECMLRDVLDYCCILPNETQSLNSIESGDFVAS
jgi:hypothetical protein